MVRVLMVDADLDLLPWREGIRAFRRSLNDELERVVRGSSRALRDQAKSAHSYVDRTGTLTRSIVVRPTYGTFTSDTLEGGVIARAPYASYVEEGTTRARAYEYLGTALVMERAAMQADLDDAVESACRKAGL